MTAATGDDDTCITWSGHEVTGSACAERVPAPCEPGDDPESVADFIFSSILAECSFHETTVHVELAQGCATRLSLSREPSGDVDCFTARLAAVRYECLGDLTCGSGQVSTLR